MHEDLKMEFLGESHCSFVFRHMIAQFTDQISRLTLPTVAILTLLATWFQLGLLNAPGFIAFPVLGLFVDV